MSYYLPSPYNSYSSEIQTIQRQLNALRVSHSDCRYKWDNLAEDGYYGPLTAAAVMKFQMVTHLNSPQAGALGDTTIRKIQELYDQLPSFRAAPGPILTSASGSILKAAPGPILKAAPSTVSAPSVRNGEVKKLVTDILSIINDCINTLAGTCAELLKTCATSKSMDVFFKSSFDNLIPLGRLDPKLRKLKATIDRVKAFKAQSAVWQKAAQQASRKIGQTTLAHLHAQQATSAAGKSTMLARAIQESADYRAQRVQKDLIDGLKKIKLTQRLSKIKPEKLENIAKKTTGIKWVLQAKDLISDMVEYLLNFDEMMTAGGAYEQWRDKAVKHMTEMADSLIDGLIAELVVLAGGALLVALGLGGIPLLVAGIIVIIVALIIGIVRDKKGFSWVQWISEMMAKFITSDFIQSVKRNMEQFFTFYGRSMQRSNTFQYI